MSDRNFLFVRMGLRYTIRLPMMCRYQQIISSLYVGLMEAVDEVGIVLCPCACMMSSMGYLVGYDWCVVSQSSLSVGE